MDHHTLTSVITLLMLACGVAIIARWKKQPYTVALVLVGLGVAMTRAMPHIQISYDLIFTIMLPPLLFQGALHMDFSRLKENWKAISLLAIPGVVVSTFFIGFILHKVWHIDLMPALLFGSLITPTDPISVLAILKKVGAPERLNSIIEGESLFNDGTGVVVFSIILGIVSGQESFHFGHTLFQFLKVAGGGMVVGLIVGMSVNQILKRLDDHLIEVAITVVLTFGTPLLAEHFHLSGIIAIVVAGMCIGNYGRSYAMSDTTTEVLENFWEVIDFIINSLLFLIIGMELQVVSSSEYIPQVLWGIGVVLLARLLVVYPVVWIRNQFFDKDIPMKWSHVLFWGGLKGSISIALVVGLPLDFPHRELFLTVSFYIVLFSLVVQGLTMKPLTSFLKISQDEEG